MNHIEDGIYDATEDIDDLKTATADSGWETIAPGSNFLVYFTGENPTYRKVGKIVTLIGELKPASSSVAINTATAVTAFTLPSGYRPKRRIRFVCQGSGVNRWMLGIETNGTVAVSRYGDDALAPSVTGSEWLPFCVTFITA